ncbi:MAG: hypothetical protein QUV08_03200 [Parasphingorhabdus sp.]|nr:hypothetical protein [Parasphingorhabdus sp.]|tara:strand:- start:482 stop:805 length:324 start_codon:yes stop_codon:yes gene_type:complete
MTACAATNCTVRVQKGHLMCRGHWFEVPPKLRVAILNSYRGHETRNYRECVRKAVEHIESIEGVFQDVFPSGRDARFPAGYPKGREAGVLPSQSPAFIVLPYLGRAS